VTWLEGLIDAIRDPAWVAGLLSTFVGAALAFVGAGLLVRVQLRHDRRISMEQLEAATTERAAERRGQAANDLGRALIDAADLYMHHTGRELLGLLRSVTQDPPGADLIRSAEKDARLLLDLDQTTLEVWRSLLHTWRLCAALVVSPGKKELEEDILSLCADTLLTPVTAAVRRLGVAMLRWDGRGAIPGREVLGNWAPIPIGDQATHRRWRAEQTALFEATRGKLTERYTQREKVAKDIKK
jgi:hypothetical protein